MLRMHGNVILPHVDIAYFIKRYAHHLPTHVQIQAALACFQPLYRAVEHAEQLFPIHGLHKVMQRRNVVPFGNIVAVSGYEYYLHGFVPRTHAPRHAHAVHAAHLNIQQQHVVSLVFVIRK